ncbi:MAG: 30S ribosomal protein S17 [Candidatus Micrarchaeota archaeon]|nr:30S ribosomal protein S17 [Candidatus Micrarchaeota archaeon]
MECKDSKCPIHGHVKTRGMQFDGIVVSDKAKRTVIVKVDYTKYIYKYERYLRKRSRIPAHNPECINAKTGDTVTIGETRRLSKTKSFAVIGMAK